MPAAAVIPASAASIKAAAVKRLAVECLYRAQVRWTLGCGNVYGVARAFARARLALVACACVFSYRPPLSRTPVRDKPPRLCTYRNWLSECEQSALVLGLLSLLFAFGRCGGGVASGSGCSSRVKLLRFRSHLE